MILFVTAIGPIKFLSELSLGKKFDGIKFDYNEQEERKERGRSMKKGKI